MEMRIPFMGFYQSRLDWEFDRAFEQMFQDSNGCRINSKLRDSAWDVVDFSFAYRDAAKDWAEWFIAELKLTGAKLVTVESPREYNFETDRVFIDVPESEIRRIYVNTDRSILERIAAELFASRSGFISFYDSDVNEWGDVSDWDHNQLYALLLAYIETQGYYNDADDMQDKWIESCSGNGDFDACIWNNNYTPEFRRLVNIAAYLGERADRGAGYEKAQESFDAYS